MKKNTFLTRSFNEFKGLFGIPIQMGMLGIIHHGHLQHKSSGNFKIIALNFTKNCELKPKLRSVLGCFSSKLSKTGRMDRVCTKSLPK